MKNTVKQTQFKAEQNEQKIAVMQKRVKTLTSGIRALESEVAGMTQSAEGTARAGNMETKFYINALMSRNAYHEYRPIYFMAEVGTNVKMTITCDLQQNYTASRTMSVRLNDIEIKNEVFASSGEEVTFSYTTDIMVSRKSNKLQLMCTTDTTLTSGSYQIKIANVRIDLIGTNVMVITQPNEFEVMPDGLNTVITNCKDTSRVSLATIGANALVDIDALSYNYVIASSARDVNDCLCFRITKPTLTEEEEVQRGAMAMTIHLHNSNGKQTHYYPDIRLNSNVIGARLIAHMNAWIMRPFPTNCSPKVFSFVSLTYDNVVRIYFDQNRYKDLTTTDIPQLEYVAVSGAIRIDNFLYSAPACFVLTDRDGNNRLVVCDMSNAGTYGVKYYVNLGIGAEPHVYLYKNRVEVYLREYDNLREITLKENETTNKLEITNERVIEGISMIYKATNGSYFQRRKGRIEYYPTASSEEAYSTKEVYTT